MKLAISLTLIFSVIAVVGYYFIKGEHTYQYTEFLSPSADSSEIELNGWIAWWNEDDAYALLERHPETLTTVSPVWLMVNEDYELAFTGSQNRKDIVDQLHSDGIIVIPTLASPLTGEKLSPLLQDRKRVDRLTDEIVKAANDMGADGIDIDLEVILKPDRRAFTYFVKTLAKKLHAAGLKATIAVHAQTSVVVWEGVEGQDLTAIGSAVDEVRVMTYDQHSMSSPPGPLASLSWIEDVLTYTARHIDPEKILVGIPTYGYIWTEEGKPYQFDEFNENLPSITLTEKRDDHSGERVVHSEFSTAWLSDSEAMHAKINFAHSLGFNRFAIWHLGGMDEQFFAEL